MAIEILKLALAEGASQQDRRNINWKAVLETEHTVRDRKRQKRDRKKRSSKLGKGQSKKDMKQMGKQLRAWLKMQKADSSSSGSSSDSDSE
jgi:hypothetical protein